MYYLGSEQQLSECLDQLLPGRLENRWSGDQDQIPAGLDVGEVLMECGPHPAFGPIALDCTPDGPASGEPGA